MLGDHHYWNETEVRERAIKEEAISLETAVPSKGRDSRFFLSAVTLAQSLIRRRLRYEVMLPGEIPRAHRAPAARRAGEGAGAAGALGARGLAGGE